MTDLAPITLNSDATPEYRGYRLQALYTLSRILQRTNGKDFIYQPEGREDLAVFDAEHNLLEIVQVKERSQNLVLSSFEPEKKDSFFYRVATEIKSTPDVKVNIVAFGNVGPELKAAIEENGKDRARVAAKIARHN